MLQYHLFWENVFALFTYKFFYSRWDIVWGSISDLFVPFFIPQWLFSLNWEEALASWFWEKLSLKLPIWEEKSTFKFWFLGKLHDFKENFNWEEALFRSLLYKQENHCTGTSFVLIAVSHAVLMPSMAFYLRLLGSRSLTSFPHINL
jgi:hypothetical protein